MRNIPPPHQTSARLRGSLQWEFSSTLSSPGLPVEKQPHTETQRNIPLAGVVLLGKSTVSAPGSSGSFLPSKGKQRGIRHLSPPISAQQLFATCYKNKPRDELKLSYQHVPALATLQAVRAQLGGTKRARESTQSNHGKIKTESTLTSGEPFVYWRSGEKDRREGRQEERSADSIMR